MMLTPLVAKVVACVTLALSLQTPPEFPAFVYDAKTVEQLSATTMAYYQPLVPGGLIVVHPKYRQAEAVLFGLLAHEYTHHIQFKQGRMKPPVSAHRRDKLEAEADMVGLQCQNEWETRWAK